MPTYEEIARRLRRLRDRHESASRDYEDLRTRREAIIIDIERLQEAHEREQRLGQSNARASQRKYLSIHIKAQLTARSGQKLSEELRRAQLNEADLAAQVRRAQAALSRCKTDWDEEARYIKEVELMQEILPPELAELIGSENYTGRYRDDQPEPDM
ncbi:MAG: hypothetical protein Q9165_003406 [Trypethelium subeluteriae]